MSVSVSVGLQINPEEAVMYCAYPNTGSGNPLMYYYNGKTVSTLYYVQETLQPLKSVLEARLPLSSLISESL